MTEALSAIIEVGDIEKCIGMRLVLRTSTAINFCGLAKEIHSVNGREGLLLETDSSSGISIWCPISEIESITVIK